MSSATASFKAIVVWLAVVALPVQGTVAVTNFFKGPAHFHVAIQKFVQSFQVHTQVFHSTRGIGHTHVQVQHHHHLPGEGAIALLNDQQSDLTLPEQRNSKGESVSAEFVGLIPERLELHLLDLFSSILIGDGQKLTSFIPNRIERPPRLFLV